MELVLNKHQLFDSQPICVFFCISPSNSLESFNWVTVRAACYDPG